MSPPQEKGNRYKNRRLRREIVYLLIYYGRCERSAYNHSAICLKVEQYINISRRVRSWCYRGSVGPPSGFAKSPLRDTL